MSAFVIGEQKKIDCDTFKQILAFSKIEKYTDYLYLNWHKTKPNYESC